MGRTEIGISRHWSNINKTAPVKRWRGLNGKDTFKIISTMRETVDELGFKPPFVRVYNDTKLGNGYGFKVMNGVSYPEGVWRQCQKAVQKLGYDCTLSHSTNYYDQTEAHSRGIRVYA